MKITVLRLGHRFKRDERLTTHVGLTSRALGADKMILSGEKDNKVMGSLKDVTKRWGGPFSVSYEKDWKKGIRDFKGVKIQLTMYGLPIKNKIKEIKTKKNLLIIVGGEKVPAEVYSLVDYNIAVGNQPHSEVAALAVFLHELGIEKKFKGKLKIVPKEKGKLVLG